MRKLLSFISIGLFLWSTPVLATSVGSIDAASSSLHEAFNTFFYEEGDSARMGSDIELLNSSGFLVSDKSVFGEAGETWRLDLTFSNAEYGNELGYTIGDEYTALMSTSGIERYNIYEHGTAFTVSDEFMFADTVYISGDPMQRWFSDASLNDLGNKDHFLAFNITDEDLLLTCNEIYNTSFDIDNDEVWMIAFEDLNLGDADYDDLVAIVSKPAEIQAQNHAPIPGSVLLAFSGMMAVIVPRIRRRS